MDSPFTTSPEEAIAVKTSFEIVMDNLNMVQKTRHDITESTTIPSTNKTNRNYIAEILWTVMLDTNNQKSLGHLNPDYPVSLD
jgi:hypothetical protein